MTADDTGVHSTWKDLGTIGCGAGRANGRCAKSAGGLRSVLRIASDVPATGVALRPQSPKYQLQKTHAARR